MQIHKISHLSHRKIVHLMLHRGVPVQLADLIGKGAVLGVRQHGVLARRILLLLIINTESRELSGGLCQELLEEFCHVWHFTNLGSIRSRKASLSRYASLRRSD